ncbi:hypothetical protein ABH15_06415 [Methanoculleus taiwanensis]|uniref:BioF2-like acetyltransferase domain-containing protein n=1 Tax=Methanoculleus taiwanensis TaxID=1550565 RepID=A0A498H1F2_9EURY|nr:GNAT family N-acetyltransferase [Methanoculleus taiwanensis]RXE55850.1 hypothetical protein ABH15_06415 [Methanoculleus taiwanensis]
MREAYVRVLEQDEFDQWDTLIAGSEQGTIFHTSDWLQHNAPLPDQSVVILGCYEDGELIGGCPLFLPKPYNLLKIASSTPVLTPYGGMVIANIESTKRRERELHSNKVIAAIREHIVRKRFDHVDLVNSPGLQDIRAFTQNGWDSKVYYTYTLPIGGDVFDCISKNARRSIRKAQKLGVSAARHFDTEMYWDLTVKTFEKHNSHPPFSKEHLVNMLDMIQDRGLGDMWVARTSSGEIAAAEVVLRDSRTVHRWSAASSEDHMYSGAISLLLSEIFDDAKDREYASINLMAGNIAHLSAFIASFNPELVPYYGVEYHGLKYKILRDLKMKLAR